MGSLRSSFLLLLSRWSFLKLSPGGLARVCFENLGSRGIVAASVLKRMGRFESFGFGGRTVSGILCATPSDCVSDKR